MDSKVCNEIFFVLFLCSDQVAFFCHVYKDSQIAAKMKFGKTKCSYFINYDLAPYIKEQLEKYISSSPLCVVSFDESMNSKMKKWMLPSNFRIIPKNKLKPDT